jgi:hypothetical protein
MSKQQPVIAHMTAFTGITMPGPITMPSERVTPPRQTGYWTASVVTSLVASLIGLALLVLVVLWATHHVREIELFGIAIGMLAVGITVAMEIRSARRR